MVSEGSGGATAWLCDVRQLSDPAQLFAPESQRAVEAGPPLPCSPH